MFLTFKLKKPIIAAISLIVMAIFVCGTFFVRAQPSDRKEKEFIKWVDFNVPYSLLQDALEVDITSYNNNSIKEIDWIELISYMAAKCGGDFKNYKISQFKDLVSKLETGETIESLTNGMEYYGYYFEAYSAVLGGMVGEYEIKNEAGEWEERYGLKAFLPIAKTFPYSDFDDFGNSRSYGYNRKHLGHDMMAQVGTPVIAIESGTIESMGWNQYGGWRIGIRSFDGKRYYYYAHLRQNCPFAEGLKEGEVIQAGDVIGYVGRTGYSKTENTNGIKINYLHVGLQLIFDESQKESDNEIWIDMYDIIKFLRLNQSSTIRNVETKEHIRAVEFREKVPKERFIPPKFE